MPWTYASMAATAASLRCTAPRHAASARRTSVAASTRLRMILTTSAAGANLAVDEEGGGGEELRNPCDQRHVGVDLGRVGVVATRCSVGEARAPPRRMRRFSSLIPYGIQEGTPGVEHRSISHLCRFGVGRKRAKRGGLRPHGSRARLAVEVSRTPGRTLRRGPSSTRRPPGRTSGPAGTSTRTLRSSTRAAGRTSPLVPSRSRTPGTSTRASGRTSEAAGTTTRRGPPPSPARPVQVDPGGPGGAARSGPGRAGPGRSLVRLAARAEARGPGRAAGRGGAGAARLGPTRTRRERGLQVFALWFPRPPLRSARPSSPRPRRARAPATTRQSFRVLVRPRVVLRALHRPEHDERHAEREERRPDEEGRAEARALLRLAHHAGLADRGRGEHERPHPGRGATRRSRGARPPGSEEARRPDGGGGSERPRIPPRTRSRERPRHRAARRHLRRAFMRPGSHRPALPPVASRARHDEHATPSPPPGPEARARRGAGTPRSPPSPGRAPARSRRAAPSRGAARGLPRRLRRAAAPPRRRRGDRPAPTGGRSARSDGPSAPLRPRARRARAPAPSSALPRAEAHDGEAGSASEPRPGRAERGVRLVAIAHGDPSPASRRLSWTIGIEAHEREPAVALQWPTATGGTRSSAPRP